MEPPHERLRTRPLRWVGASLGFATILFVAWQWATWPDVAALVEQNPSTSAFIESAGGTLRWTPYAAISDELKMAVVVSEDIGFFSHGGFAKDEMREALREAWKEGELPRGASTITQQLAKNLWLSAARHPWRKAKEALLTRSLERHLGKRRILELYLNVAEFGPGVFGAGPAARRYFGKPASDLDLREAAQLAAGLPRPARWNPRSTSAWYARRVRRIEGLVVSAAPWLVARL